MTWTISAASVTGTSHTQDNTPCQDAYHHLTTTDALFLAVADGAGSAPHSKTGATLATTTATSYLAGVLSGRRLTKHNLHRALNDTVHHCRNVIAQHAEHPINDLATTLLIAAITTRHIGIAQIGDGAIVTCNSRGRLTVLTRQQEREYVNEVTFLTSTDYERELHTVVQARGKLTAIALFTDGVETLCIRRATNEAHPKFFHPLFAANPTNDDLAEILTSPAALARTDDDKTILLATTGGTHALR